MAIYRGPGGSGDATGDATTEATLAIAAANAAAVSETNAANSASAAATSASNAASSASTAAGYAASINLSSPAPIGDVTPNTGAFTSITTGSLTDTGLTSGRVTFASTGGLLADNANLTWDGTTFSVVGRQYLGSASTFGASSWAMSLGNGGASANYFKADNTYWQIASGAQAMLLDSNANLQVGNSGGTAKVNIFGDTALSLYNTVATSVAYFSTGATLAISNYITAGSNITFSTNPNGGGTTERMRIDSSGRVSIGATSLNGTLNINSNSVSNTNLEMDTSAASSYLLSYNRTTSAYSELNLRAASFKLSPSDSSTNAMSLDNSGNLSVAGSVNSINTFGFKNRIINGGMDIWQRATTYALTNAVGYGSADRWNFWQGGASASGIANQVASGLTGFRYAVKLGRNSGSALTGTLNLLQALETSNSIDLAGQSVTLSFWAKAGANYSSTSNLLSVQVYSGTGTDQSAATLGTWTGVTLVINGTPTLTTSWVKYSFTGTFASTITQAGILIGYSPTGTAGADDNLYITGIQLEKGSIATSFDYRPNGTELALCQRYYEKSYPQSIFANAASGITDGATFIGVSTVDAVGNNSFKVVKRTSPTVTLYAPPGGSGAGSTRNNVAGTALTGYAASDISEYGFNRLSKTAGIVVNNSYSSHFTASAEL